MRTTTNPSINQSLRRLVTVLAVAGVVSGACGSSPLGGGHDSPAGSARVDRDEAADACRSLDELRRLGELYGELAEDVVLDAVRTAEDDPDVDRDELALAAMREMLTELDQVAVDLLDAYREAADAAPDVADDLEFLADFTEDVINSWSELLERPDADPEALLDTIFAHGEEELLEAVAALERVNAFTIDECGFDLSPRE